METITGFVEHIVYRNEENGYTAVSYTHLATAALTERSDVIIVSSVSCIYGLGSPVDYQNMMVSLRPGMERDRDDVCLLYTSRCV